MLTESVRSRGELVANSVHTADADATRRDSTVESRRLRRCVSGTMRAVIPGGVRVRYDGFVLTTALV